MASRNKDVMSMAGRHVWRAGSAWRGNVSSSISCFAMGTTRLWLSTLEDALGRYQEHLALLLAAIGRPSFIYEGAERFTSPRRRVAKTWSSSCAPKVGEVLRQIGADILSEPVSEKLVQAAHGKGRDQEDSG
jgi:hypothetical protein